MNLDFISVVVGMISSIFIPFVVYLKNSIERKSERKQFRLMIYNEYVEPITKLNFDNETCSSMREKILKEASSNAKKLEYLKEKELTFLATDNKFYYLRVVVYTDRLLNSLVELSNSYGFRDTLPISSSEEQAEKEILEKKMKSKIEYYELNLDRYANLKTDKFQAPD